MRITNYAKVYGTTSAIKYFKTEFPHLRESTVRGWLKMCREKAKERVISQKRGRPLSLPPELDEKLQKVFINLRKAGGSVNRHVVSGVLLGLIKSNLTRYGQYLEFCVANGRLQYSYKLMNMSRRTSTTSRPVYLEVRTKFLHGIVSVCLEFGIPDKLIINIDQTPSKYVATDRITMPVTGSKHVSKGGSADKRSITATFAETLAGVILPFELI